MSGTRKAICKGNTLTMYASFNTSKNGILNSQNKKAYIKYGKHTFKLTSKTKYYFSGGEAPNDYCSKSAFMSTMRSMNGLGLRIKVTNGKVVEIFSETILFSLFSQPIPEKIFISSGTFHKSDEYL